MNLYWDNYHLSQSLTETISLLENYNGHGRVVAGGTDLILQLMQGKAPKTALVDISRLEELKQIKEDEHYLRIGALCTHSQITDSTIIQNRAAALAAASGQLGSPQIRSVGTLGGNVVNAYSGADTAIALLALDAKALIISGNQETNRPLSDLYTETGQSKVDPTREIIKEFIIPKPAELTASSFKRLARRKAVAKPTINTAVALTLANDRRIFQAIRITVGPVAAVPWRAQAAESGLIGQPVNSTSIEEAAQLAAAHCDPRDGLEGDANYRRNMVKVLVSRAIREAVDQLGGIVDD
jgi:carbon-monoxide dehydrogenase medium subunit